MSIPSGSPPRNRAVASLERLSKSPKAADAWMLAGAPPQDLAYRAVGLVPNLTAVAFHDRAKDAVTSAGFSVGDWPGGPFLRGVIIGRREIYGQVMGERNLSDSTPPKKSGLSLSAILFATGIAIFIVTLGLGLGGYFRAQTELAYGIGFLIMIPVLAAAAFLTPRQHQFDGEMLVVRYTADPPPGQGQQVFNGPTQFRVEVSAGRALSRNITGRNFNGRIVVRGLPGSPELGSYPGHVLDALKNGNPIGS